MKCLGVGVIGMGWMGESHSSAYLNYKIKFPNGKIKPKLIICSEIIELRAKQAKEKFGFEKYTTNWKDVVDDENVHIVDITAPNSLHLEIIEYCIKKGKHINCEKPVGAFPRDTIKAYELVNNYPMQTFVGFNYRWAPLVQYTKNLIKNGKLGDIYHYRGRFFSCYAADELAFYSWRFEKENGLGAITDLMSHVVDMAIYLIGNVKSVNSNINTFIKKRPIALEGASHYGKGSCADEQQNVTNDDYVNANIVFENGVVGYLDSSRAFWGPTSEMSFEIHGSKGSVKWNFEEMNTLHLYLKEEDAQQSGYRTIYSNPSHPNHNNFNPSDGSSLSYDDLKTLEIANFLEKIENEKYENYANFKSSYKVAKVLDAMIKSNNTRKEEIV